ncbi:MAG TPA: serine/threonine-protein kinase [Enhygromyxa sp.]|nr:serine/threonine-protein kinase [Enhygromyxa sp.]
MASYLHAVDDPDEPSVTAPVITAEDGCVVIAERYELLGRIGRGATGTVYRAFDRTLDRQVAIKLLHPGELEVGEREAQVLAKVTHRNVVTIHDYGHYAGHRYLVLELLEGPDLRTWLRERPPATEILENFIEAGRGLAAAHHAGLVHRDFKPSNVIVTNPTATGRGRVVVIDFGLARNLDSLAGDLEPQRFTEGTLAYMAPERLAGHDNDERSDQFAFCVSLWEALAGSNPFTGEDPLARYRSIRRGPVRVELGQLGVAKPVVAGLERGMSFEREARFSTMDELLRELQRPASTAKDRRNRPVLMAVAVAATFLIGVGLTPESPIVHEAYSSLDPTADAALAILDSAHKRAVDGDVDSAVGDLVYAAELMTSNKAEFGSEAFCAFGTAVPKLGDLFLEKKAASQAVIAFAIASRFAQNCPELDLLELNFRREAAQGAVLLKTKAKTQ